MECFRLPPLPELLVVLVEAGVVAGVHVAAHVAHPDIEARVGGHEAWKLGVYKVS